MVCRQYLASDESEELRQLIAGLAEETAARKLFPEGSGLWFVAD